MCGAPLLVAALFTGAQSRKQPTCPCIDDWIEKWWHVRTVEYRSAVRNDEIGPFVTTRMDLEAIVQREISRTDNTKKHVTSLICGSCKQPRNKHSGTQSTVKWLVVI